MIVLWFDFTNYISQYSNPYSTKYYQTYMAAVFDAQYYFLTVLQMQLNIASVLSQWSLQFHYFMVLDLLVFAENIGSGVPALIRVTRAKFPLQSHISNCIADPIFRWNTVPFIIPRAALHFILTTRIVCSTPFPFQISHKAHSAIFLAPGRDFYKVFPRAPERSFLVFGVFTRRVFPGEPQVICLVYVSFADFLILSEGNKTPNRRHAQYQKSFRTRASKLAFYCRRRF